MYEIEFYETEDGKCPIWDFLEALRLKAPTNKDARIQHKQASLYIELLHQFRKKSQKTPKREIEKAKAERNDYLRRKETAKL
ncbi:MULTISPECIES: type II toxin-antitoxin system RelE/ParE family toxin [Faecalibacterium]|jgi:hypothetical protein|uniref:type II toxin-antitoxin system RelE/ParE family toxin n=1 Tax=Faecalibacterium TaxID=216851 RepID=UPI000E740EA7|nr:type II toxin-antitoxin system RelE/ParE family toxin [Faecalibacterium sp. AM43-5AT]RJV94674.1 hypothetical protein DW937_11840 [Faecalibacterium sp. AM43-5AT]